jgi:alpha-beta hydrolase superfamily lysophospholipase
MVSHSLMIGHIPAIVWGEESGKAYIFVHGKKSCKEEAQGFAALANQRGFQTLSFDLPEHGARQSDPSPCDVRNGVRELNTVGEYAAQRWRDVSLFANSLGAYFSLLAYRDYPLESCLFLSPILDMERLIRNMMAWTGVNEETLREKRTVPTPIGETLDWDYYQYVKAHSVDQWDAPTAILYGSEDNLTQREVADNFAARFNADLEVLEGGEHFFHTEEQLAFLNQWLARHIPVK